MRLLVGMVCALLVIGCDDGDDGAAQMGAADMGAGGTGGDGVGGEGGDGGDGGDDGAGGGSPSLAPQSGLWFFQLRLVELGGIEVPFQMELEVGLGVVDVVRIRAVGPGRSVSEPILVAESLPIDDEGFDIPRTAFTMPAAFSPTSSDVDLDLAIRVEVRAEDDVCGVVTGEVVTLETTLEASTFAAVPWGTEAAAPLASCEDVPAPPLPRRMDCPAIEPGLNMGFMSAGIERDFRLFLPADHDPGTPSPAVFLFHGLGSSGEYLLGESEMADFVDDLGFVLVVPESHPDGAIEWDSSSAADNLDLAFFDDLSRCVVETQGVDPGRIYTAGLSAGSFESVYLGLYRSEVVAASAALSTGLLAPPRQDAPVHPFLTAWGGPEDFARGQSFEALTNNLNAELRALGHPVITCDHGMGHVWDATFTPWVLRFLLAHRLGDALAFDDLSGDFPDYCQILP